MSTPLKIQRMTGLEKEAMQRLRLFYASWQNGSMLVLRMIAFTDQPDALREALTKTLARYIEAKQQGASDMDRLALVLKEVFAASSRMTPDLTPELFAQWCAELKIPEDAYLAEVRRERCH